MTSRFSIDKSLAISAGAGTGKTYTLSRRYLNILLGFHFFKEEYSEDDLFNATEAHTHAADPQEILTITYTEAGASEMKYRIHSLISEVLEVISGTDGKSSDIYQALAHYPECVNYVKNRLLFCKDRLIYASISTIHSFALNILKQTTDVLQWNSTPVVLMESEKHIHFNDALRSAMDAHTDSVLPLAQSLSVYKLNLVAMKYVYDRKFREFMDSFAENIDVNQEILEAYKGLLIYEQLPTIVNVLTLLEDLEGVAKNPVTYGNYYRYAMSVLDSIKKFKPFEGDTVRIFAVNDCDDEKKELSKCVADLKKKPCTSSPELEHAFSNMLRQLHTIVRDVYSTYKKTVLTKGFLDSDLILSEASVLVDQGKVNTPFKYFMIDEFQDTNESQWQMLWTLCHNNSGNMFIVGDPKQSIFAFQGAEVEVFGQAIRQSGAVRVPIKDNWRSTQTILNSINTIFRGLFNHGSVEARFSNPVHADLYKEFEKLANTSISVNYEDLEYPREGGRTSENSTVRILATSIGEQDPDVDMKTYKKDREHQSIANLIARIRDGVEPDYKNVTNALLNRRKAVAVLFNTRDDMEILKDKLEQLGITPYVNTSNDFYKTKEIGEMYFVLRIIRQLQYEKEFHKLDRFALAGALRSSLIRKTDGEIAKIFQNEDIISIKDIFKSFIDMSRILPIASLIQIIISQTKVCTVMGHYPNFKQRLANLDKLVSVAGAYESAHCSDLEAFVNEMKQLIFFTENSGEKEAPYNAEGQDSVILTTIHASKGLQYPMVILPQMQKNLLKRTQSESFKLSKIHTGTGSVQVIGFKVDQQYPVAYTVSSFVTQKKELGERIRLFYVALTRAETHIVLSMPQTDTLTKNSYMSFYKQSYQGDLIEDINTFLDTGRHQEGIFIRTDLENVQEQKLEKQQWEADHRKIDFYQFDSGHESVTGILGSGESHYSKEAELGTAFHELVAGWFNEIEDNTAVEKAIERLCHTHLLEKEAQIQLRILVDRFKSHPLYPELKNADERYFEQPFTGENEGIADLLYKIDGLWKIVDFKTGHKDDKRYNKQLAIYKEGVERCMGIKVDDCQLMYVGE